MKNKIHTDFQDINCNQEAIVDCLVIGDSWSSAHEADTGNTNAGWPDFLRIPKHMRQAVGGSTAAQWARDFNHRLTNAINTPANMVILSLLGNDVLIALADRSVSPEEINSGVLALRYVIEKIRKNRTIVLLYADPFNGRNIKSAIALPLLNATIVGALPEGIETFDTGKVLLPKHFDGRDIHPTREGYRAIATGLLEKINSPETKDDIENKTKNKENENADNNERTCGG